MTQTMLFEKDPFSPIKYVYEVTDILYRGKSAFQEFMVVANPFFGRMLVLNGVVQFTERDEFYYHEMMAHVALHALPDPKKVIVIGGGDGGVVREVVKHDGVERVYLVDIDSEVGRVSREFFPSVSCALSDPRVVEVNQDGAVFMKDHQDRADAIIVDSTDIIGHAKSLYTREFFENAAGILDGGGLLVTLSESMHFHMPMVRAVQRTLASVFPKVDLYTAPIATYAGNWWCFAVGSTGPDIRTPAREPVRPTRYYCDEVHRTCFLPRVLYDRLMEEDRESL